MFEVKIYSYTHNTEAQYLAVEARALLEASRGRRTKEAKLLEGVKAKEADMAKKLSAFDQQRQSILILPFQHHRHYGLTLITRSA